MPSSELSAMFCYVYVLRSVKNGDRYIGFTVDLKNRITEHNNGKSKATKPYLPWELIFYEAYRNELDARRREKYLKTTQGREALRKMLNDYDDASGDKYKQKVYY
jgi:putative endonuclease